MVDDYGSLASGARTFAVGQISRHDLDGSRYQGASTAIDGAALRSLSSQCLHEGLSHPTSRSQHHLQISWLGDIPSWILESSLRTDHSSKIPKATTCGEVAAHPYFVLTFSGYLDRL